MTIVNVTPDSFFAGSRTPHWLDVERLCATPSRRVLR